MTLGLKEDCCGLKYPKTSALIELLALDERGYEDCGVYV